MTSVREPRRERSPQLPRSADIVEWPVLNAVTSERCPSCGGSISGIDTACRYCGGDLRRGQAADKPSTLELLARLEEVSRTAGASAFEQVQAQPRRASIIEDFPIPDDKAAVLELLAVSVGNVGTLLPGEEQAWAKKARQLLALATVHSARDPDYQRMTQVLRAQLAEAEARQRGQYRVLLYAVACLVVFVISLGFLVTATEGA